jgi:prepilin-type N-terminal cleavage/methylation domain-containing protein
MGRCTVQNQRAVNNIKGFSLIEVLIVLLIGSILVVAAVPQVKQSLRLYRVESAAGLLSNSLTETRLTAIKYNRAAWLEINAANRKLEIWTTDQNNQPMRLKLVVSIPSDVSIGSGSPTRITFNSLGRNQANSNVVVNLNLPQTNFCKSITVSAVGNISTAGC